MKRLLELLDRAMLAVGALIAVGLVAMALAAVYELALQLMGLATRGFAMPLDDFYRIVGTVLEVFIIVELFHITLAYLRHQNVVPTVLEAALVAVARKFVVFEGAEDYLQYSLGLASLLIAVAIAWFLLQRSNACELRD